MHRALTFYATRYLTSVDTFKRSITTPMLVWEAPPEAFEEAALLGTHTPSVNARPTSGDPSVFELKKDEQVRDAFGLGIMLGRTYGNDIVIEDNSVSRFHAFFQRDASGKWTISDADSRNGTFIGERRLEPRRQQPLEPVTCLRIGSVEMTFYEPAAFVDFIRKKF